jgi:ABC-2 type transport system permease protein
VSAEPRGRSGEAAGRGTAAPRTRPESGSLREGALNAALASAERPPRAGRVSAALTFGWRGMLKIKHVPEQLLDVTITPVLFVLMFTYLFGGAIVGSTTEYLQFILPAILAMSVLFTTIYSGVTLNTDVTKGVIDRFRSLPIPRAAPLVGAVLGDSVRYLVAATVIMVLGVALGYRPDAGIAGVLGAVALVVVFASGLSWVFTTVGLLVRTPNAVMNAGFMALFPITFVSNAFVEPATLPSWLESIVEVNPMSHLVTGSRGFMDGTVTAGEIAIVVASAAALTAIFAPLTVRLYRTKG